MGGKLLDAVRKGRAMPESDWPKVAKRKPPPRGIGPAVELLKVLLKLKCEENDVAQRLVANTADLEQIAGGGADDVRALHGWRRKVFGEDALALRSGRLALSVERGRIRIDRSKPAEAAEAAD